MLSCRSVMINGINWLSQHQLTIAFILSFLSKKCKNLLELMNCVHDIVDIAQRSILMLKMVLLLMHFVSTDFIGMMKIHTRIEINRKFE